jgi:hypothetical protein
MPQGIMQKRKEASDVIISLTTLKVGCRMALKVRKYTLYAVV